MSRSYRKSTYIEGTEGVRTETISKTAHFQKSEKVIFRGPLVMQAIQKIQALVQIYDLRCVDYFVDVPEILKFDKLMPDVLQKYMPSYTQRVSSVAFSVCYQAFLKTNPQATLDDFQATFLTSPAGITAYQEALNLISPKVKEVLTTEDIESLYKPVIKDPLTTDLNK